MSSARRFSIVPPPTFFGFIFRFASYGAGDEFSLQYQGQTIFLLAHDTRQSRCEVGIGRGRILARLTHLMRQLPPSSSVMVMGSRRCVTRAYFMPLCRGAFTTTVRTLSPCQEAWHAAPRPLSSSFKLEWILTSPVFEGHTLTQIDIFYEELGEILKKQL